MPSGWIYGVRTIRVLIALLFTAYNLMPLYGLWAWNWDAFQLLMLYWSETVVLAGWTMVHIAFVPLGLLGDMTVNGKSVKPSHAMLIGFFSLHAGVFIAAHLLFLCLLFSGDWFSRLHGVGDFAATFYIASGAWIALTIAAFAGGADVLTGAFHPRFVDAIEARLGFVAAAPPVAGASDPVGGIVGALYGRIVLMQVAIIFGAWAAHSWGSLAPLVIMIAIKTVFDFGNRALAARAR